MAHIVTQNTTDREEWLQQLSDVITDPEELLRLLSLADSPILRAGIEARKLFPLRVPRAFVARMKKGDARDPLLLQVIGLPDEFTLTPGYSNDPLEEQSPAAAGAITQVSKPSAAAGQGQLCSQLSLLLSPPLPLSRKPG